MIKHVLSNSCNFQTYLLRRLLSMSLKKRAQKRCIRWLSPLELGRNMRPFLFPVFGVKRWFLTSIRIHEWSIQHGSMGCPRTLGCLHHISMISPWHSHEKYGGFSMVPLSFTGGLWLWIRTSPKNLRIQSQWSYVSHIFSMYSPDILHKSSYS